MVAKRNIAGRRLRQWIVVDESGAATWRPLRQVFYPNGQPVLNNGQPTYSITGTGPRKIASTASTHKDFTAINLGKMKAVSAPFYERLAQVYAPFPYPKPWAADGGTANDFTPANLGQLKRVFSFDLDGDSDGDGLTDLQELTWTHNHPNQPNGRVLNPFVSNAVDTDGDGLNDAEEMYALGTNPDVADTDGDGFKDGEDRYPLDNRRSDDIAPKNFAVVDLTTFLPENMRNSFNTKNVSMDESGHIAFYGYSGFDGKDHVYVWNNGAIDYGKSGEVPLTNFWTVGDANYWNVLRPAALGASGKLTGVIEHTANIGGQIMSSRSEFSWKPGDSLPSGWNNGPSSNSTFSIANVSISPNGAHTVGYQIGGVQNALLVDGSPNSYFYSDDYSFQYYPAAITDSGRFLVSTYWNGYFWGTYYFDGNNAVATPFNYFPVSAKGEWPSSYGPSIPGTGFLERPSSNAPTTSFAMNDNHQFVTREPNGDVKFYEVWTWTWTTIPFLDLLKWNGKHEGTKDDFDKYKNHLTSLTPKIISNVSPSTAGMVIAGQTFTNGAPAQIYFTAKSAQANTSGGSTDRFGNPLWSDTQDYFLDLIVDDAASTPPQGHYILRQMKVPTGLSVYPTALSISGCAVGLGIPDIYTTKPVLLLPVEMRITDRDDPKKKWTDNVVKTAPVYSGKSTGDMVSWKLGGTDSWTNATFSWTAEGPETKTGPSGTGKNEWKIADGDEDTAKDWVDWKPGKYKIKCAISFAGGSSSTQEFEQEVGVRTDDVVVVGWIDGDQVTLDGKGVQASLTQALPQGGLTALSPWQSKANAGNLLLTILANGVNGSFEIGERNKRLPFGPFSDADKTYALYWQFKYANNRPPLANFTDDEGYFSQSKLDDFINTEDQTRYKLLNHYQAKFLVTADEKIENSTLTHIGKAQEVYIGNTKDPSRTYEISAALSGVEKWLFDQGLEGHRYPANGLFPGQAREHNSKTPVTTEHESKLCNEGTPDQKALDGFKRLTGQDQGYIWSSITFFADLQHYSETVSPSTGQSLTRAPKPTEFYQARINTQIYPTYWFYINGKKENIQNQANTPSALFPNKDKCQ